MSGKEVSCECWCPCMNVILTDDYDTREIFICGECAKNIHEDDDA